MKRLGARQTFDSERISQFDTASPISLIKENLSPSEWVERASSERYEGISGTVLGIKGVVKLKISYEGAKTDNVTLKVVADETMRYSALLGRNILRMLGLGLTKVSEETGIATKGDILNIEPSVFDGAKIEKILM